MVKKLLSICTLLLSFAASAQGIHDGAPWDSTSIRFNSGTPPGYVRDTAATPLWQIGRTHKTFFTTDTSTVAGIMTDTTTYYPANANNSFTIKVRSQYNLIIDFWHKYQTHTGHAGGIVEFSADHGATWQNIKGDCNTDSLGSWMPGIKTENCYTFNDTLFNGQPAFTGTSGSMQYSRFQFLAPQPLKGTSSPCTFMTLDSIYIRFRFVSDTATDTLAGWIIDSVKAERDIYEGAVRDISRHQMLKVYPSPSPDGIFTFPAIDNEAQYTIEVYNTLGQQVHKQPYGHSLQLTNQPKGLYFYKVGNGMDYYSGQLLIE